jgi:hypothetical protein
MPANTPVPYWTTWVPILNLASENGTISPSKNAQSSIGDFFDASDAGMMFSLYDELIQPSPGLTVMRTTLGPQFGKGFFAKLSHDDGAVSSKP